MEPVFNSLIVRYSEIGLKSQRVRRRFEERLVQNIRKALDEGGVPNSGIVKRYSRVIAYTSDPIAEEVIKLIPGVRSLSPAIEVDATVGDIKSSATNLSLSKGGTFAVRTQRITKDFPLTSLEVNRMVGLAIRERTGRDVDLGSPDQVIGVEIVGDKAYAFDRRVDGPGGLPVSTQGRVVALISGGIDSPVAAWLLLKRGASVAPLHFKLLEEDHNKFSKILRVLRRYSYGSELEPIVEDWRSTLEEISSRLAKIKKSPWTCVFCKRSFLKRAESIAEEQGAFAIATGDSLGEVASQTLQNLEVESYGRKKPILRPLIGSDKEEIVRMAKKIGTYEISIERTPGCPFRPFRVVTSASWERFLVTSNEAGLQWLQE